MGIYGFFRIPREHQLKCQYGSLLIWQKLMWVGILHLFRCCRCDFRPIRCFWVAPKAFLWPWMRIYRGIRSFFQRFAGAVKFKQLWILMLPNLLLFNRLKIIPKLDHFLSRVFTRMVPGWQKSVKSRWKSIVSSRMRCSKSSAVARGKRRHLEVPAVATWKFPSTGFPPKTSVFQLPKKLVCS